jgi:hypothetical protein
LRLLTVFPLRPDLSVPFFRRRMALATRLDAALPYFRLPEDFRAAILGPSGLGIGMLVIVAPPGWLTLCREWGGQRVPFFAFSQSG